MTKTNITLTFSLYLSTNQYEGGCMFCFGVYGMEWHAEKKAGAGLAASFFAAKESLLLLIFKCRSFKDKKRKEKLLTRPGV